MKLKVQNIREKFLSKLEQEDFVTDKTGVKTIEIVGASFLADKPAIFGKPTEYIERELAWYESQSLNVNDIPGEVPEIWKAISSRTGLINSNYGYLIYSKNNGRQYANVLEELQRNPNSRRACMVYNRPSMHGDYNFDGMNDFICTFGTTHMIRNGKLETVVNMRSNDGVFGYKNDYAWFKHVHDKLVKDLGIESGDIHWQVSSLHVYERHFKFVK